MTTTTVSATSAPSTAPVYDIHVFCCINERAADHPRSSCAARGSVALHKYLKIRCKELKVGSIRVNKAGCLDRCELGPIMVIYPRGIWYHFDTTDDVEEILQSHILGGQIVNRLVVTPDQKFPISAQPPKIKLRVKNIAELATNIRKFEFVADDGGDLPAFTAGGHVDIFTHNDLRRSYSISSDPLDRSRYEIAVLRERDGTGGSSWMHDVLAVGDVIETTAPKNNFPLNEDAREHILVAGGIGISPLLSMGRRLKHLNAKATLHYCSVSVDVTAYIAEVKDVFGDRVKIYHDGGDPTQGMNLNVVLEDQPPGACLYICGSEGFVGAARAAAAYWPPTAVRYELFTAPADNPNLRPGDEPFDIVLSRQGKTLTVPKGKSILDVVRGAGVRVESSCEAGSCGTCKVALLDGAADHRDTFLSDEEKQSQNTIMVCSSRAQPGQTLILDL